MSSSHRILAFSHIPKTGGLTLVELLRQHFGLRHLDVVYRTPVVYMPEDLRTDRRLSPRLRSIAGHSLKPYVDFSSVGVDLAWYTFVREPIARFASHFQHEVEKGGKHADIEAWMTEFRRENWQVRMLAGSEDLAAAIEIVDSMDFVGTVEQFDRSLVMLNMLPEFAGLDLTRRRHVNPARSSDLRERIREQVAQHEAMVHEQNALDIQLYEHVTSTVWPRMLARYDGDTQWEARSADFDTGAEPSRADSLREAANRAKRNVVYKPVTAMQRRRRIG